jgi:uncharacterized membrane protein
MMTEETKGTNAGASVPKKGDANVGFIVLAFTNELAAEDALKDMEQARKQRRFYFENAAVIRQDASGNVHYRETGDMPRGGGAGVGALIGGTLGILGGPVGVALGAGAGAALGAAIAKTDDGFKDANLKKVGIALRPGSSAVAVITDNAFLKDFQKQIPETEIRKFVNGLAKEISTRLDDGKNIALGILLTDRGLAIQELAVAGNSSQVVNLLVTNPALLAGVSAVATEEVNPEETGSEEKPAASA